MINELLKELYKKHEKNLKGIFSHEDIDGPILIHCWEDDYFDNANIKILFIGKETNGWLGHYVDDIEYTLKRYKDFGLCTQKGANRNSKIWKYIYKANSEINPSFENRKNFLWTNVSKCCIATTGKKISEEEHDAFVEKYDVLEEEIKIINPDVIIFFSGPQYDRRIKNQFNKELKFTKFNESIPLKELARVEHPSLPKMTYRIYHPDYMALYRPEKQQLFNLMLEEIKSNTKNT